MNQRALHGGMAFAVGSGRCGTNFLAQVLDREPDAAAHHERNPLGDAFHSYCRWHGLPVDSAGFVAAKRLAVEQDLRRHALSFEASAFLSNSVRELHRAFQPKFVLIVRSPEKVVNSFLQKGWYEAPEEWEDRRLAPGIQPRALLPHHSFSRIAPRGDEVPDWPELTRVGKLAWFWAAINGSVLQAFADIPAEQWRVVKLEDLDHDAYRALADFMGISAKVQQAEYQALASSKPNRLYPTRTVCDWSDQERAEFEKWVRPLGEELGYETRTEVLASRSRTVDKPVNAARSIYLGRRIRAALRGFVRR